MHNHIEKHEVIIKNQPGFVPNNFCHINVSSFLKQMTFLIVWGNAVQVILAKHLQGNF